MADGAPGDAPTPRADLKDAAAWLALGAAILAGSASMDRLADQGINPYTPPGLLPGLLGIALLLLGGLLAWRSLRQGALAPGAREAPRRGGLRVALVIGLCVAFDTALVGHGLPFWAAAALFVAVAILALQGGERRAAGRELTPKAVLAAALAGLGAGGAVTLVFQQVFLVRLP